LHPRGKGVNELNEKVKELEKALEAERKRAEEYLNRLKYLQADFENYVKRVKRDVDKALKLGNEKLILKLIDVKEDLERTVQVGRDSSDKEALVKGVELIHKKLDSILREEGVRKIEALGKIFNPSLHEAVGFVETSKYPEGTIVNETRKGYLLGEKVIRPSAVEVAKAPLHQEVNEVSGRNE